MALLSCQKSDWEAKGGYSCIMVSQWYSETSNMFCSVSRNTFFRAWTLHTVCVYIGLIGYICNDETIFNSNPNWNQGHFCGRQWYLASTVPWHCNQEQWTIVGLVFNPKFFFSFYWVIQFMKNVGVKIIGTPKDYFKWNRSWISSKILLT